MSENVNESEIEDRAQTLPPPPILSPPIRAEDVPGDILFQIFSRMASVLPELPPCWPSSPINVTLRGRNERRKSKNQPDLLNAMLVCKSWSHFAAAELWRSPTIATENQAVVLLKTLRRARRGETQIEYLPFVQHLEFGSYAGNGSAGPTTILKLFRMCSATVQKLTLHKGLHVVSSTRVQWDRDPHSDFIALLLSHDMPQLKSLSAEFPLNAITLKAGINNRRGRNFPNLKDVHLEGQDLGDAEIASFLRHTPRIESVWLDARWITDEGVKSLITISGTTLKHLHLGHSWSAALGENEARAVISSSPNLSSISFPDFGTQRTGSWGISDTILSILPTYCPSLTALDASRSLISGTSLHTCTSHLSSLKCLSISGCTIDRQSLFATPTLTLFEAANVVIDKGGVGIAFETCIRLPSLEYLDMRSTDPLPPLEAVRTVMWMAGRMKRIKLVLLLSPLWRKGEDVVPFGRLAKRNRYQFEMVAFDYEGLGEIKRRVAREMRETREERRDVEVKEREAWEEWTDRQDFSQMACLYSEVPMES